MKAKALTNDELGILFLIAAILFGGIFRLIPAISDGYPINDGALFLKTIETIQAENFHYPKIIEFNGLEIPFAYPPFAFYLLALLSNVLGIPNIILMKWFPAITLVVILPAVYYFSSAFFKSRYLAGLSTLMYAFLPRSITWLAMGGGITRSVGQLFLILATANIYLLFKNKEKKYLTGSILFGSGVCLSHPEACLHTIAYAACLFILFGRNWEGVKNAAATVLGVFAICAPWLLAVTSEFGADPFMAAGKTGLHDPINIFTIFLSLTEEPYMTFISSFAILGLLIQLFRNEYILPILYLLPIFIEPRSAANVMTIPMAMLAAVFTIHGLKLISKDAATHPGGGTTVIPEYNLKKFIFIGYFFIAGMFGMGGFEYEYLEDRITPQAEETFAWIRDNTNPESKFVIITGKPQLFQDYINEWFPYLTDRTSLTTIQGHEWLSDTDFGGRSAQLVALQLCPMREKPDDCIDQIISNHGLIADYLLVDNSSEWSGNLIQHLMSNKNRKVVYRSSKFVLFLYR